MDFGLKQINSINNVVYLDLYKAHKKKVMKLKSEAFQKEIDKYNLSFTYSEFIDMFVNSEDIDKKIGAYEYTLNKETLMRCTFNITLKILIEVKNIFGQKTIYERIEILPYKGQSVFNVNVDFLDDVSKFSRVTIKAGYINKSYVAFKKRKTLEHVHFQDGKLERLFRINILNK
ncbi:MAG: hypothetical protein RR664_04960 [Clostridia bacterium]